MFRIFINDGSELPTDDIFYIIAKDGIFLKKKMGILESLVKVDKISILEDISSFARMHIAKIPRVKFAKIVSFFREVHSIFQSESIVLLYYNIDTMKYRIVVPNQKVSGFSLSYVKQPTPDSEILLGTIHSHGSMGASHSGIDDKDEIDFDGLHITVGDVDEKNENNFSLSCSIVSNGQRFMVEPEDYIESIRFERETFSVRKIIGKVMGFHNISSYSNVTTKKYYIGASKREANYPFEWLTKVICEQPTTYVGSEYDDYEYWSGYGDNGVFPHTPKKLEKSGSHNYKRHNRYNRYNNTPTTTPTTTPNTTPILNQSYNPCDNCVFKNYKSRGNPDDISLENNMEEQQQIEM